MSYTECCMFIRSKSSFYTNLVVFAQCRITNSKVRGNAVGKSLFEVSEIVSEFPCKGLKIAIVL